jgi:hypothetical protein
MYACKYFKWNGCFYKCPYKYVIPPRRCPDDVEIDDSGSPICYIIKVKSNRYSKRRRIRRN